MRYIRRFAVFWIDFIIGDAWEVAAGIAVTLAVVAFMTRHVSDSTWLGFVLLGAILVVSSLPLARAAGRQRD
jgi:hypothetical protein